MNKTKGPYRTQPREVPDRAGICPKRINFGQMYKFFIFSILILMAGLGLKAQQSPQYSLYMMNPFVYNPAIAGTHNYYQIRSNHRFQWAGFKDAPITNSISAFGPHSKKDMGFGGTISNDVTGPTSRTSISGVYSYNLKMTSDIRISMGLSVGMIQYKIDGTKIIMDPDMVTDLPDNALGNAVYSKFMPDASVGVYVYASNFFGGFSANQLINNKFKTGPDELGLSKLSSHFYLIGGYKYFIDRQWAIEPTLILKKVIPAPFQLEIDCKVIYNNMLWGGLAFRTSDAVSILMGYTHQKKFYLGYSFDYTFTAIRNYTFGSHEIVMGVNFNPIKKIQRKKR